MNETSHPGPITQGPLGLPPNHLSFRVTDLPEAVEFWSTKMKAGPFFYVAEAEFDQLEAFGGPAVFEHSFAFGQWGEIPVELQQLHRVEPDSLRSLLEVPMNHVGYVAEDAEAASAELDSNGMPMYMFCARGPIAARFHSLPTLSHSIEIHQGSDFLNKYFLGLRTAAAGWGGEDPLREDLPPGLDGW